ncbi:ferrous iron transporter A [Campylobacter sp. MIT 99-7217]|uniref:fibronectin type III domain-containing protein n=1 Tax=Campylobacter sp. MIT 99-7217 TaxID=535091 RepID=UPI00115B7EB3|nr:fibronectin type III domain-containing protein [Campylobacter sp. MIT 99-7217]TQR33770.1 ferrous iron transporter A [Campylobacter sp. MIT 99-7217]
MKKLRLALLSSVLILLFSACVQKQQNTQVVNESLPRIENLKHISDMNSIAFEWSAQYDQAISGFYLYRSTQDNTQMQLIATIKNKFQTHFVDKNLEPATKYTYMMRTFNSQGHVSEDSAFVQATTLPRPASVPFVEVVRGLPNKVKLIWRPHPDLRVASYVIERAEDNKVDFKSLAEVKGRLNAEYIDDNLKPNRSFEYRIFAKTFDGVYSESSEILQSTTKALPPQINSVSASKDVAGKIVLTWESVPYEDFAYYQVYASSSTLLPFSMIAKTQEPAFEDIVNEVGKSKRYKITMVDKDGLESPMPNDSVQGQTLAPPQAPSIISATPTDKGIELLWTPNDHRAVKYAVKRYGGGDAIFKDIADTRLEDITAEYGRVYTYEVIAIDINGLESKPSSSIKTGK